MHEARDDPPAATPLALWLAALQWWVLGELPALSTLARRMGELALPSA